MDFLEVSLEEIALEGLDGKFEFLLSCLFCNSFAMLIN